MKKDHALFAALNLLHIETWKEMEEVATLYGLPLEDIEERHKLKAKLILTAPDLSTAQEMSKKAVESLRMSCSVLAYYLKRIPGPKTPESLEKKAKQAENLAKFQESLGKDEAATKQKVRAESLRAEAASLRETSKNPPPMAKKRTKHPKAPKAKKVRHEKLRAVLQQAGKANRQGGMGAALPGCGLSLRRLFRTLGR